MAETNIDWKEKAAQYAKMAVENSDRMDFLEAEVERLRTAIISAPCTQHSIPCGWPCDSEMPCWKQYALGSDPAPIDKERTIWRS